MSRAITEAGPDDWPVFRSIAELTWPATYGNLLPADQLFYMLEHIYNEASLRDQMNRLRHRFAVCTVERASVGFASWQPDYQKKGVAMIHKLYVLPGMHGKGIGRLLMDYLTDAARREQQATVRLKVFHVNAKAIRFYETSGFVYCGTEETVLENGYVILDNVMEKSIRPG